MTHATMAEEGFTKAPFSQQSGQKTGESGLQHRPDVSYELHDASFLLGPGQRYSRQQFSHLYYERLVSLRAALRTVCAQRWPNLPVCSVLELEERQQEGEGRESQGEGVFKDGGRQVVLVGTIYKHMPLKPSILDEYMQEVGRVLKDGGRLVALVGILYKYSKSPASLTPRISDLRVSRTDSAARKYFVGQSHPRHLRY
eukprot:TRINITY_DN5611_c0_g1_i5.p1 TRINITY_DN5611_c0_g1~~TRINITY_DN5611_c0_g1_i5.p1  ORF type:complete len:199 (+),score=22.59 TRINITY_DN5611_c0_g1_i5:122-718(+)